MKEKLIKIYLIKNKITGKLYIGQTKRELSKRLVEHARHAFRNNTVELSKDLRWFGLMNFEISLLEEINDPTCAFIREQYYIDLYNTIKNGYNMKLEFKIKTQLKMDKSDELIKENNIRNGLSWNLGISTKKYVGNKISKAKKGKSIKQRKQTEETKLKISLIKKKYYETHDPHNMKDYNLIDENGKITVINKKTTILDERTFRRIKKWSAVNIGIHPTDKLRIDQIVR